MVTWNKMTNDLELIRRARSGDEDAMARLLFDRYDTLARHIALKMPQWMRRLVDVDDVLQDAFGQVYRDIRHFEIRSEVSFTAWLKTVASNRLHDRRRKLELAEATSFEPKSDSVKALIEEVCGDEDTPSHLATINQQCQALHVAIARLPEDQQQAIRLYFLEQRNLQSVAAAMRRTPNAVRGLVHRAKQTLRGYMGRSSLWYSKE